MCYEPDTTGAHDALKDQDTSTSGSSKAGLAHSGSAAPPNVEMAPSAAASSQNVTIPVIPELYDPNFLDALLPKHDVPLSPEAKAEEPNHLIFDALKITANRTQTTDDDPAHCSTLSATHDAFLTLRPDNFYPMFFPFKPYDYGSLDPELSDDEFSDSELSDRESTEAGLGRLPNVGPSADLNDILSKAWEEDPALTLRIIWNCRSIHNGKNQREIFYQ